MRIPVGHAHAPAELCPTCPIVVWPEGHAVHPAMATPLELYVSAGHGTHGCPSAAVYLPGAHSRHASEGGGDSIVQCGLHTSASPSSAPPTGSATHPCSWQRISAAVEWPKREP